MARDQLPPIEFDNAEDVSRRSSSSPPSDDAHRKRRPQWWVVAGGLVVVVLVLVAASTMRRLSDERDEAKAEAARTHEALLGDLGAMFTLPSSPCLSSRC